MSFAKQEATYRNIWIFMNGLLSSTKMKLRLWSKETCGTNGDIMYVPSSWAYTADPQVLTILEGMVIHEALGHGLNTDHKVYGDAAGRFGSELGSSVLNILEDIFIETRCFNAKPGARNSLSATVTELVKKKFFGSASDLQSQAVTSPAGFLVNSLLIQCRARLLGGQQEPLQELLDASESAIDATNLRALWTDIWSIAAQSVHSRHTQDNVALTQKILDLIAQEAGDDASPNQGDGQANEDGEPEGDSNSDTQAKSKPKKSSKASKAAKQSDSKGDEGEAGADPQEGDAQSDTSSQPGQANDSDGDSQKGKPDASTQKAKQKAAQDILDSQDEKMPEVELTDLMNQIVEQLLEDEGIRNKRSRDFLRLAVANPMGRCSKVASVSHRVKRISDDLQDALMSQTRCIQSLKMSGRRLSSANLSRVAVGNPYIFKHKDVGEGLSTAVSLLVDDSGSMSHMSTWCSGLTSALGDILDEFEIPFEVALFSDEYARIKDFDQSWGHVSMSDNNWSLGGCTLAGAAAQESVGSLACRTEDRRMLVFVTDGDTPDVDKLESVYSESLQQGIEIASIMMGQTVPQVRRLAAKFGFPATTCNNVDQLASFALERILNAVKA